MNKALVALVTVTLALLSFPLQAGSRELKVLTYNVGLLRALGNDLVAEVALRAKALPEWLKERAKADAIDVIALQEVWEQAHADEIEKALKGYKVIHGELAPKGFGVGSGVLIAVREETLQVNESKFVGFEQKAGFDRFSKKGILVVKAATKDATKTPFVVATSHFQVLNVDEDGDMKDAKGEGAVQLSQYRQMGKLALDTAKDDGAAVVLAGDFNSGISLAEANYFTFLAEFPSFVNAPYAVAHKKRTGNVSWSRRNPLVKSGSYAGDPSALIDIVFVADGKKAAWKTEACDFIGKEKLPGANVPPSDHYGTLCRLTLADK